MAVMETQKRYPDAKIVDYLHVGRKALSPTVSEETFKLCLKQSGREFCVNVRILFDASTEQVKAIHFQETSR